MKTHEGVNKLADDLYFIAQPVGNVFTGITVLVEDRAGLVDSGMPPAADEYVFPLLRLLGKTPGHIDIVVCTHWHGDHVACAKQIKKASGATIAIHVKDRPFVESLSAQREQFYGRFPQYFPEPSLDPASLCPVDLVLRAGDKLKLGKRQFEVLHLPGHTPGSIGLYDRSSRLLLTGDSIQGRGVGGHLAMIIDVSSYLAALSEAAKLPVDCLVMDHSYSPFSSAILTGGEVSRFFRESIRTVEQYIAALQAMARGRKQMNLAEATDFLCARFGTRPRSLMAMCTAESILRRLGVAPQ